MVANSAKSNGLVSRIAGMRTFKIQLAALVFLYTVIVYGALYYQNQRAFSGLLRTQGESYAQLVKSTRTWNSDMGGVWVVKRDGVDTNPYLEHIGIPADLKTEAGTELTLRNPSAMTQEISKITEAGNGVFFHLVSGVVLNPENSPDAWEESALDTLENTNAQFAETIESIDGRRYYRYMSPLAVDKTCLACHQAEGYTEGDLRGGITINIPLDKVDEQLRSSNMLLGGLVVVTLVLSVGASQWFVDRFSIRLDAANEKLSEMAVTDDLTGLANRRALFDRLGEEFSRSKRTGIPVSVIELDIDYFKQINDRYGHGVGDEVLREIAERMSASLRGYDMLGRVGGEEFLVVSPNTDLAPGTALAERMLDTIRSEPFSISDLELKVTMSAGVSTIQDSDVRADDLVARADDALYAAKRAGRNCVRTQEDLWG